MTLHQLRYTDAHLEQFSLLGQQLCLCRKDRGRSDSMEEACALMELPWVYRKAVLVVNNLEV